jgi:hypothetical protein
MTGCRDYSTNSHASEGSLPANSGAGSPRLVVVADVNGDLSTP